MDVNHDFAVREVKSAKHGEQLAGILARTAERSRAFTPVEAMMIANYINALADVVQATLPDADERAEALRALIRAWRERQYARRMTGDETTPLPCGAV